MGSSSTTRSGDPSSTEARATLRDAARVAIETGWAVAARSGALPAGPDTLDIPVAVERPANADHGDLATNLALRLARPLRMAPPSIAAVIAGALNARAAADPGASPIASASVAGPGFINLHVTDGALEGLLAHARDTPPAWGRSPAGAGRSVNVEFVSANPTGPLTVGNARGAFAGDLLCRVLAAGGQRVTREYYFNDSGAQVDHLGASVIAVRDGTPIPEDGYHGDYVADLAQALPGELIAGAMTRGEDPAAIVGRWASQQIRTGIEVSLATLGVHFDVWKTEGSLHSEGWVGRAVDRLREGGHIFEQDGALWFRSTTFGDDKDRVVIRSNGEPTYFASDIGYVTEKFSRGFDHLIYIWGSDHHGTVARVRNAAEAMGFDKSAVEMILTGWVRFVRDGVEMSMSKRAGTFVTLDELLSEIGVDAARWFFASRGSNVDIDFDIELAKKQSNENPVYYVQYAHARIASILRKAAEAGLAIAPDLAGGLTSAPEAALARVVVRYPEVVEDAAAAQETQGITAYATEQGHIEADPAAGITRASAGGREKARERVLSWDEIKAFLVALDVESMAIRKLSPQVRIALKWLLLTGQRISETLMTEWVHLDAALWTLPAGNTKSGRDHFVDLTTETTALLDELRPLTGAGKYLFESSQKPGQPVSRYAVERALFRLLNDDTLKMAPFTPHDLRRTAVTRMSDIGIAPHVIEKIVNHKMAGVMGIYNRSKYLPERKAAIEAWNNRLQELTGAGEEVGCLARV